ncbi:hypothetical protein FZEAL_5332 [Fusarium zealandicum]|uniref:Vacuolar protein sorting-associated protein 62 n=1 Tax=Fusarium zealandicum TaxID=1053134 RepID=A0A8H4UKM7_9HYPO|nr:hypothetical protein FZEAL_5332 [Fusarium zealandicum]
MANPRCLSAGPSQTLFFLLLVIQVQIFLVQSKHILRRDAVSSILDDANRTVPEYITRHGALARKTLRFFRINADHHHFETAPLVWLHSDDPFRPSDILEHIRRTTPTVKETPIPGLPKLDLDNLDMLNGINSSEGQPMALTSNDDVTDLPTWLLGETPDSLGRISNATPCVVIMIEQDHHDVDVFFFYFYSYDRGGNISQVMQPLHSLAGGMADGMHYGDHVGDCQHSSGAAYQWNDTDLSLKDERPLVYSAYGSHANYASSGLVDACHLEDVSYAILTTVYHSDNVHDSVLLDWCDAGQLWDPVLSAYFYHMDPDSQTLTRLFLPGSTSPPDSNLTSFLYYSGIWGDAEYSNDDARQKIVPI